MIEQDSGWLKGATWRLEGEGFPVSANGWSLLVVGVSRAGMSGGLERSDRSGGRGEMVLKPGEVGFRS